MNVPITSLKVRKTPIVILNSPMEVLKTPIKILNSAMEVLKTPSFNSSFKKYSTTSESSNVLNISLIENLSESWKLNPECIENLNKSSQHTYGYS